MGDETRRLINALMACIRDNGEFKGRAELLIWGSSVLSGLSHTIPLPRAEVEALMAVRPLDLSNLLKHAFICGRVSAGAASSFHSDAWVEYDPTESAAYARILAALQDRMK